METRSADDRLFAYLALSLIGLMFPACEKEVFKSAQPVLLAESGIMLWLVIVGAGKKRLGGTVP
jgi:hypothetical protein